jgi:hypothetical protein
MIKSGTLVPLAWPETPAVIEGKWYDHPMKWVGVVKDDMWPVGHAAMLIVDHSNGEIHYMDFGRYHTPHQKGRVRDKYTDPDVTVYTIAIIVEGEVINFKEILHELSVNPATHGFGKLIASSKYIPCFNTAFEKAKSMQNRGAIYYGPLKPGGTNCSRFVAQVSAASPVGLTIKLLLKIPYTASPSPFSNVKIINDYGYYFQYNKGVLSKINNRLYFLKKPF